MKSKKLVRKLALLTIIIVVIIMPISVAKAFSDPSNMSDSTFFGVWDNVTSMWITEGIIDYSYDAGLSSVENYVKQGNYASAKTSLLNYYKNRTSRSVVALTSSARNMNNADLVCDDIFTSTTSTETYMGKVTVGNSYQTVTLDVFDGVERSLNENEKIAFLLMSREKITSLAGFYSKEQESNKPTIEVTVNGQQQYITAEKDTFIRPDIYGDTNFGTGPLLAVKDWGVPFDYYTRRTFIEFDLSGLSDAPTAASLKLYGKNLSELGDMDVMVFRLGNTTWEETELTWNTTSGMTFSWQGESNSSDWNQPSSGAYGQWRNDITRFYFFKELAYEYFITSNTTYSDKILSLMLDFINDQGNTSAGYPRSLDTSIRVANWITAYDYIVGSTSMDSGANIGILKYIWQMANYLGDETKEYPDDTLVHEEASYHSDGNWGVFESEGLYKISVYFPEFKKSSDWQDLAETRLSQLIKNLVKIDGAYIEDSSGYVAYAESAFYAIKKFANLNSQTLTESFDTNLQRIAEYDMNLSLPDGYDSMYGDAAYYDHKPLALDVGNTYSNNYLKYFGSDGASGTVPFYNSMLFPEMKIATMRTGWSDNDHYMMVSSGAGTHGHPDLLNVIGYAYGRVLIADPGRKGYDNDPITNWIQKSTEAHNTIEINDTAQGGGSTYVDDWAANGYFDFFEGRHTTYSGFVHRRDVLFIRPTFWIVSDYVTSSSGTNKYEQNWHLLPDADPTLDGTTKKVETDFVSGPNIQIVPADPANLTASLADGYYSPSINNVQDAKYASYVKNVSGDITFDTVLYPTTENDTSRNVKVTRLTISPGVSSTIATALKIDLDYGNNGNIGYYYLSHEERPYTARSFDDYYFNGKTAYVETDYNGSIKCAAVKSGSILTENTTDIIVSDLDINDMGIKWDGSTLEIYGSELIKDNDSSSAIAIYAPSVTSVKLNGNTISHTKIGNYIYAVRQHLPAKVCYEATEGFSSVQGINNWYYQSYDGSSYSDMEWDSRWELVGLSFPYVYQDIQAPGSSDDSVRKWVAPYDGVITIKGNVAGHPDYTQGDGTRVKILKNTNNVWPYSGWQSIAADDHSGYDIDETISVNVGDAIYFIVNRNVTMSYDHVLWSPEITLFPSDSIFFDDFEDADASGWTPLTPLRWTVGTDLGDYSYYINTSDYNSQSGDRPGEYSLIDNSDYHKYLITMKVKIGDNISSNVGADLVVIFNYQDSNNYYYLMLNNNKDWTQLFKVLSGARILLADTDGTDWVADNNYHTLSVERSDDTGSIVIGFDDHTVIRRYDKEFSGGQVGIGSYNDSACFDDVIISIME